MSIVDGLSNMIDSVCKRIAFRNFDTDFVAARAGLENVWGPVGDIRFSDPLANTNAKSGALLTHCSIMIACTLYFSGSVATAGEQIVTGFNLVVFLLCAIGLLRCLKTVKLAQYDVHETEMRNEQLAREIIYRRGLLDFVGDMISIATAFFVMTLFVHYSRVPLLELLDKISGATPQ